MNVASSHAPAPLLVRRHEAAKMLAVHVRTLDGWLASGKLPSVKKGARCLRIRVSDLLKFIGDT
jgi:excisionase family DNA binding protein